MQPSLLAREIQNGLKHYTREAISFTQDNDFDTMNAKAKGYERYSVGYYNWRSIYGSFPTA